MTDRYYSAGDLVYSHRWEKTFSDGTKSTDAGGLICVCPDGINSEVVARKLNLGDIALSGEKLVGQRPIISDSLSAGGHRDE